MKKTDSIRSERHGFATLYLNEGINAAEVLNALDDPGELLKDGDKRTVRRVGNWVVKSTRMNWGLGPLKITTNRNRYRNNWVVSHAMEKAGLPVPRPIAYIEFQILGIIWRSVFVYEYLDNSISALDLSWELKENEQFSEVDDFLKCLSHTLQPLAEANVNHRDLKLNNLLTQDRKTYFYIDLDDVDIDKPFKPEYRMRNHIQMANGLSRAWERSAIDTFLKRTVPHGEDIDTWIERVWQGVEARRSTGEIH